MKKRFIAYCIGMFLATLAFVTNANAQYKLPASPPCDDIEGFNVEWQGPVSIIKQLECGCEAIGQYYFGIDESGRLHISMRWTGIIYHSFPECTTHIAKDRFTGKTYNIDDIGGILNYLEKEIMEFESIRNSIDLNQEIVISSQASCREYYKSSDFPGGIMFEGTIISLAPTIESFAFTQITDFFHEGSWTIQVPCGGNACCVSYLMVDQNFNYYPPVIEKVIKTSVYAEPLIGNCTGSTCKYDCENNSYEFIPSRLKASSSYSNTFEIIVSPNPNNGNFSIYLQGNDIDNCQYKISNNIGQVIYNGALIQGNNSIELEEILTQGSYTISIYSKNNLLITKKIIISK
jgi:hypothetical protein